MRLIDADELIPNLEVLKFKETGDLQSELFNMAICKSIDTVNKSPTVDAKVKTDKREYQRRYYQNVTKLKRQEKRNAGKENL